jgi:putative zinc finger protein
MSVGLDCDAVRERLPALALDDLDFRERRLLHAHLALCPDCARERRDYDETLRWLDDLDRPAAAVSTASPRRRRWWIAALAAAAVVVIAILAHRAPPAGSRIPLAGGGEAWVESPSDVAIEGADRLRLLRGALVVHAGTTPVFADVGDTTCEVERGGEMKLQWKEAGSVAIAAVAGLVFVAAPGAPRERLRPGSIVERDAPSRDDGALLHRERR